MPCDLPNRTVAMCSFKVEGNGGGGCSEACRPLWEFKKGKEAKSGFLKEKDLWGSPHPGRVNSFWSQLQMIDGQAISSEACVKKDPEALFLSPNGRTTLY